MAPGNEVQTVAGGTGSAVLDPPPIAADFTLYRAVLEDYLEHGAQRQELAPLGREMAAQQVPLPQALEMLWSTALPFLETAAATRRGAAIQRVLQAANDLAEAYDQALQMDRRAHLRLASAYAQKIRSVNTLLDNLPAFVFLKDRRWRYSSVNRVLCDALDLTAPEIIGKTDHDLFPGEIATQLASQEQQALEKQTAVTRELSLTMSGQPRTVLLIEAPVISPEGEIDGLIGVGFDLTERKATEAERDRLAAAVQSIGEAVCITDVDGVIQYVNAAFETVTGYGREQAIGKTPSILKSGKHDREFYRAMWETLGRGELWRGTVINRKQDGSLFEADLSIAAVHGEDGAVASFVGVTRDITERQRMIDALQRAVMVKSEFTSMVSHELRTPLTAIKEAIDVVEDQTAGPINAHQRDFLTLAKRNVDRLHRLINDTLDFSKLERGEFCLEPRGQDLNAVVGEVVQQQSLPAQNRGLEMQFLPDPDLPQVWVDADRVSQVLVNLIGNAIRYCDHGSVRVRTQRDGSLARVEIEDTGPGIPQHELEHIFDAFVQLSSGPHRRTGGTGLGLAISKKIIELHGGRLWAESEVGQGSRFIFTLGSMDGDAPPRSEQSG